MDAKAAHIESGWIVAAAGGREIGKVKEVRDDHIVVTQGTFIRHDLYIPIDHVTDAADGKVSIRVDSHGIDQEGWRYPPNAGVEHENPAYPEVPDTTMIQSAGYSAGRLSAPETQGAVLDDDMIEPGEVPNTDIEPDVPTPNATEETETR
jgi:hypothetical protein